MLFIVDDMALCYHFYLTIEKQTKEKEMLFSYKCLHISVFKGKT